MTPDNHTWRCEGLLRLGAWTPTPPFYVHAFDEDEAILLAKGVIGPSASLLSCVLVSKVA